MLWLEHDSFGREFKKFSNKFPSSIKGLEAVKKLLEAQFDPSNPKEIIAPGKIHRVHQNAIWELWKIEALVVSLRPNQWPRIWFVVNGDAITLLVIATHIDNYDNNAMDKRALDRISDLS